MKSKAKKDFKVAQKLLIEIQSSNPEEYLQLNKLLIKYDLGEIGKETLYQFLLRGSR